MRLRVIAAAAIIALAAPAAAAAQSQETAPPARHRASADHGTVGLGVIFGEPTGLSGKVWTTERTAFDFGVAWSFQGDGHFHLHADYLFHNFSYFDVDRGSLPFYLGIGGRVRFHDDDHGDDDSRFGVRFVVGLEYFFEDWPMAVFVEVVPILDLAPETEGDVNGGLGLRFYF
ncbi:MAG: hypothetical protein PHQ19_00780 [Candidatus Krumholzibacteria bacterium]|nr:hypothetical protein [Candidatus Krumholzibacteria bacterium]